MDLKAMLEVGFHRSIASVVLDEVDDENPADKGRVQGRLVVDESLVNLFGKLHGGAIATLVDDIGTLAIVQADHFGRIGVTTDLQVSYLAPAALGDVLSIEARVLSCGLAVTFVEVTLAQERRGRLVARGRMTKLLGDAAARKAKPTRPMDD